jgi:hypothetical protein
VELQTRCNKELAVGIRQQRSEEGITVAALVSRLAAVLVIRPSAGPVNARRGG